MAFLDQTSTVPGLLVAIPVIDLLSAQTLTVPVSGGAAEISLGGFKTVVDAKTALAGLAPSLRPSLVADVAIWAGQVVDVSVPASSTKTTFTVSGNLSLPDNRVAWVTAAAGFTLRSLLRG